MLGDIQRAHIASRLSEFGTDEIDLANIERTVANEEIAQENLLTVHARRSKLELNRYQIW